MIGIPLGLLTANAVEWVFHKHVLHELVRTGRVSGRFIGTIITAMCAGMVSLITITVIRP